MKNGISCCFHFLYQIYAYGLLDSPLIDFLILMYTFISG